LKTGFDIRISRGEGSIYWAVWVVTPVMARVQGIPPDTVEERHDLAVLALGDKCPPVNYFAGLHDSTMNTEESSTNQNLTHSSLVEDGFVHEGGSTTSGPSHLRNNQCIEEEFQLAKLACSAEIQRLSGLLTNSHSGVTALKKASVALSKISNEAQLINFLLRSTHYKSKIIPVQPTFVARRRFGVTRGCKRVAAGTSAITNAAS